MSKYVTKTGQNLYDVALTLYGSVEGIFDLLVSNENISLGAVLPKGTELEYHKDFMLNKDIAGWLTDNKVNVKNGSYKIGETDMKTVIKNWIEKTNSRILGQEKEQDAIGRNSNEDIETHQNTGGGRGIGDSLLNPLKKLFAKGYIALPDKESVEVYYDRMARAKMKIVQLGSTSTIGMKVMANRLVVIDWGDNTPIDFYHYTERGVKAMHTYSDGKEHEILMYGDVEFMELDFTEVKGIYYALTGIRVTNKFTTPYPNATELNKLFKTDKK